MHSENDKSAVGQQSRIPLFRSEGPLSHSLQNGRAILSPLRCSRTNSLFLSRTLLHPSLSAPLYSNQQEPQ